LAKQCVYIIALKNNLHGRHLGDVTCQLEWVWLHWCTEFAGHKFQSPAVLSTQNTTQHNTAQRNGPIRTC